MPSTELANDLPKIVPSRSTFRKILVATDGSEAAKKATVTAIDLAKNCQAKLILLVVIPTSSELAASNPMTPGASKNSWRRQVKKILGDAALRAREEDVKVETKTIENMSSTVHAIITYALDERVDLVVVGTRGIGGFEKLLLGSVSSGVVKRAPCSVLVVR